MEHDDHPDYEHVVVVGFDRQQHDLQDLRARVESLGGEIIEQRLTWHGGEIQYRSRWRRLLERLHLIEPA